MPQVRLVLSPKSLTCNRIFSASGKTLYELKSGRVANTKLGNILLVCATLWCWGTRYSRSIANYQILEWLLGGNFLDVNWLMPRWRQIFANLRMLSEKISKNFPQERSYCIFGNWLIYTIKDATSSLNLMSTENSIVRLLNSTFWY